MEHRFVIYPAQAGARFDRDYYETTHLPLVRRQWGPQGLQSVYGFYPVQDGASHVAVAVLVWEAGKAEAAMSSDAAKVVFDDVPRFTEIQPAVLRGLAP